MESKQDLRQFYRKKRSSLTQEVKSAAESSIVERLKNLLSDLKPRNVAAYRGFKSEVCIDSLFDSVQSVDFCFPRVIESHLEFYQPNNMQSFSHGTLGVLEPESQSSQEISLQDCQMVLVPGVSFDRQGERLGLGKGYYDRALQNFAGSKVGVCFKVQVAADYLPKEEFDVTMDYVVTEDFMLVPIKQKRN